MNVEQWTFQDWVAAMTITGAFLGLLIRGERRFGRYLTREEHEKICEQRSNEQGDKLDVIRADIREIRDWLMNK
jgi:hypothetical protein